VFKNAELGLIVMANDPISLGPSAEFRIVLAVLRGSLGDRNMSWCKHRIRRIHSLISLIQGCREKPYWPAASG
jgi:hypothetical protein